MLTESEIFRGLSSLCRVRHPAVNQNALYRSPLPPVLYDDSRRFEISRCSTASINNGDLRGKFSRSASILYFSSFLSFFFFFLFFPSSLLVKLKNSHVFSRSREPPFSLARKFQDGRGVSPLTRCETTDYREEEGRITRANPS